MKGTTVFLIVLCVVVLSACGGSQQGESTATPSASSLPPKAELMKVPDELKQVTLEAVSQASVDVVNDSGLAQNKPQEKVFHVKGNAPLSFRGWAYDETRKSVPSIVWIELTLRQGGQRFFFPATRHARPDVVEGFKVPWATMSGFGTPDVRDHNLPLGTYDVKIYQVNNVTVATKYYATPAVTLVIE